MTEIEHHDAELGRGPGHLANIGLIALESDLVIEPDVNAFARQDGVAVFANRIPIPDHTDHAALVSMLPHIERVCRGFVPLGRIDAVIYGCTAGSVAMGPAAIAGEINKVFPGVPVTTPISAVLAALKAMSCRSVDLLTPYADDVTEEMIAFLGDQGIAVERCVAFGLRSGLDMGRIEPRSILEASDRLAGGSADALFISCTALHVAPVFEAVSARQVRPMVTSNQALAWHALRLAGLRSSIPNVGPWLCDRLISAGDGPAIRRRA
ncbi:MAG: hypothetical protein AAF495_17160 [Pseudomonadota bacterium]